jgi:hypothetical protein
MSNTADAVPESPQWGRSPFGLSSQAMTAESSLLTALTELLNASRSGVGGDPAAQQRMAKREHRIMTWVNLTGRPLPTVTASSFEEVSQE